MTLLGRSHCVTIEPLESRALFSVAADATDLLVMLKAKNGIGLLSRWARLHRNDPAVGSIDIAASRQLLSSRGQSLVKVALRADASSAQSAGQLLETFSQWKRVAWAQNDKHYGPVVADDSPNDPLVVSQDYLGQIHAAQAWDVSKGRSSIIVAVVDDGVWRTHEDLKSAIWTNAREIAGDGKDNDANGYIDDVNGWNFANNNNNVTPVWNPTNGGFYDTHGSIVAGLIAATMNNAIGIAGVAGGVKIMPVRFNGYGETVTSSSLAGSIIYAANNGARIINVSYSIDEFANDAVLSAAITYAYGKGVLCFGSAGNANQRDPARTNIERVLYVSNVNSADVRAANSNYGTGIDVSAPGVSLLSTYSSATNNWYAWGTGTSFSTAVASGVAALTWSAHPGWTRDQVAAQLVGTTDSINAVNPAYAGLLGSGRVNAQRALGATVGAPKINSIIGLPPSGNTIATPPAVISIDLRNVLKPSTVVASAFELRSAGKDGVFNTADDVLVPLSLKNPYFIGTNRIVLNVGALTAGGHRFTISRSIQNPFGAALDGNGDGVAGDALVRTFTYAPATTTIPAAPGNLVGTFVPGRGVVLTWKDNSPNESSFVIERGYSNWRWDTSYAITANTTTFTDAAVWGGVEYQYRVKAINATGSSSFSNIVFVRIG